MKVLYDHQIFTQQHYGGISRYFCELMDQWTKRSDIRVTLALRYSYNENLSNKPHLYQYWSNRNDFFLRVKNFPGMKKRAYILRYILNNQKEAERLLKEQDFGLVHPTYYNPYFLPYLKGKPYVITVYDMIHELFSETLPSSDNTKEMKKRVIEQASGIIAISKNTKNDIVRFYDIDPTRITVIPLSNSIPRIAGNTLNNLPDNYLLYIGDRHYYKNFKVFLTAISPILQENKYMYLVCGGSSDFTEVEKVFMDELGIRNKVIYFDVDDTILSILYQNALCFVFPSLYEGFGLPILEAFHCGCPVLCSNTSSLPEVAGDAAFYFNPNDESSIYNAVDGFVNSPETGKNLIQKGLLRLNEYSWEKTAKMTRDLYHQVLQCQ
ncbi:MAG: glycosyltransferase family 4 protein [Methanolinea sp.]